MEYDENCFYCERRFRQGHCDCQVIGAQDAYQSKYHKVDCCGNCGHSRFWQDGNFKACVAGAFPWEDATHNGMCERWKVRSPRHTE